MSIDIIRKAPSGRFMGPGSLGDTLLVASGRAVCSNESVPDANYVTLATTIPVFPAGLAAASARLAVLGLVDLQQQSAAQVTPATGRLAVSFAADDSKIKTFNAALNPTEDTGNLGELTRRELTTSYLSTIGDPDVFNGMSISLQAANIGPAVPSLEFNNGWLWWFLFSPNLP